MKKQRSNRFFVVLGSSSMFNKDILFLEDRFAECMEFCKKNDWCYYDSNSGVSYALGIKEIK